MNNKKNFFVIAFLMLVSGFNTINCQDVSHDNVMKYQTVAIQITEENSFSKLASLGIEPSAHKGNVTEQILSEFEVNLVIENGFQVDVLIEDMTQEFLKRNAANVSVFNKNKANTDCETGGGNGIIEYESPTNFELGSMGGYFTLEEVYDEFNQMHSLYPNLISALEPVSDFETFEGRNIFYARVSDNPDVEENEPQQLLTAIHHAREPESISQLIFYLWYLLENYDTNPEVQTILNNTELLVIPMVNPDGYNYNAVTEPNGGGFWRKNRRDHGGGSYGVDPNRNYDVEWGTTGISFNTNSDVYCGSEPFSEPETQAIKWFCENHDIKFALNYHTYSELLLYPYGYALNQPCADDGYYQIISSHMVSQNGYTDQISAELYPASGDSDDWMYDETPEKGKIFAFTPEIGYAFWPVSADIVPIAKEMMFLNLTASHLVTDYALATDESANLVSSLTPSAEFSLQSLGLDDANAFSVSIEGVSSNVSSVGAAQSFSNMTIMETANGSISYELDASIVPGDVIEYNIVVDQGGFSTEVFVSKIYGALGAIFSDDGNDMVNWTSNLWDTTTETYYSAPSCFTDSPNDDYDDNEDGEIVLNSSISLAGITSANITFFAKWDIEADYDYVQLLVNDEPQCGLYTTLGTNNQDNNKPLWEGVENDWLEEFIDLSDYLGQTIEVKFLFVSDGGVTEDGFYFDDFAINTIGAVSIEELNSNLISYSAVPNPAKSNVTFTWNQKNDDLQLRITNEIGQVVLHQDLSSSVNSIDVNVSDFPEGIYFYSIGTNNDFTKTKKLVIVK